MEKIHALRSGSRRELHRIAGAGMTPTAMGIRSRHIWNLRSRPQRRGEIRPLFHSESARTPDLLRDLAIGFLALDFAAFRGTFIEIFLFSIPTRGPFPRDRAPVFRSRCGGPIARRSNDGRAIALHLSRNSRGLRSVFAHPRAPRPPPGRAVETPVVIAHLRSEEIVADAIDFTAFLDRSVAVLRA
jgi:hypothetical protein